MVDYTHPNVGVLELNDAPFTSDPSRSFFNDYWTRDLFTFKTEDYSSINLNLHEISDGDNANLRLYRDTDGDRVLDFGEPLLDTSMKSGSADDTINYRAEAGDYIAVVSYANGNSDPDSYLTYSLDISATPTYFNWTEEPLELQAPNLLPVDEFGVNLGQIDQSVGDSDTSDVFRFSVTSGDYPAEIRLDGLSSDADIRLIDDNNGDNIVQPREVIASSIDAGSEPDLIRTYLDPGDYYLQVYQFIGDTDYHLEFDEFDPHDLDLLVSEEDLGTINEDLDPITNYVGPDDSLDTYRFYSQGNQQLDVSINGLQADADLLLIQDSNNNGVFDYQDSNNNGVFDYLSEQSDELIDSSYAAGTSPDTVSLNSSQHYGEFFLQVHQYSGSTNYDLNFDFS